MESSPPQTGEYTPPKPSLLARLLRPKVAIPLTLLALLILSPVLIRGYYLSRVPDFPEPFDTKELYAVSVLDDENAFEHYRLAMSLYVEPNSEVRKARDNVLKNGWSNATRRLKQNLHENADALLEWKTGSERRFAQCIPVSEYDYRALITATGELREFARTAATLSYQLESEGRVWEAWSWLRAAVRASRHAGTNGGIVERLIGCSIFQVVADRIENFASNPSLSSEQLRQIIREFDSDWQLTVRTSGPLRFEYLCMSHTIEILEAGDAKLIWRDYKLDVMDKPILRFSLAEPDRGLRLIRFMYHNLLTFADRPRFERPPSSGRVHLYDDPSGLNFNGAYWTIPEFDESFCRSIVAVTFKPLADQYITACNREEALFRTMKCVLAAQAYYRDYLRLPSSLQDLVPRYLSKVPVDPFSGKLIKYSIDSTKTVIYSVSANGLDDGGDTVHVSSKGVVWPDIGYHLITPGTLPLVAPRPPEADGESRL